MFIKKFIQIIFFLLLVGESAKSQRLNDLTIDVLNLNLKGKVKSIIEVGNYVKSLIKFQFNQSSKLTEVLIEKPLNSNEKTERWKFEYDKQGRTSEMLAYNYEEYLIGKTIFNYDSAGYRKEMLFYGYGSYTNEEFNYTGKLVFYYDKTGNKFQTQAYAADGSEMDKIFYTYDIKGNLTIKETKGKNKLSYKYDQRGNIIEIIDGREYWLKDCYYLYDKNGNWIKLLSKANPGERKQKPAFERTIIYY